MKLSEAILNVCDMKDPLCAQGVEQVLGDLPGVHHVQTNPVNGTTVVHYDQAQTDVETMQAVTLERKLKKMLINNTTPGKAYVELMLEYGLDFTELPDIIIKKETIQNAA